MGWGLWVVTCVLGALLVWGLVAPRGMWRSVVGWSVADRYRDEPGGAAYGIRRVLAGIGVLGLIAVAAVGISGAAARTPGPPPQRTPLQLMWGPVEPRVVNRVVVPVAEPHPGLVEEPIAAYQDFDDGIPPYVSLLPNFRFLGHDDVPGFIGTIPPVGNGALDFADLVINVRGPLLCVPRDVVMFQTEESVRIGVYYGLPRHDDGTEGDSAEGCAVDGSTTASVLIPLQLTDPIGDREVLTLDGQPIAEVPVVD